jgi:predicted nucleic-acid-binding Zn-ribbon protein
MEVIKMITLLWKCSVCGFTHTGPEAPDVCPKCGAPKEKFVALTEEEAKKVIDSERTNDIHMEIIKHANRIVELAKEGLVIQLDPPCVSVFEKALAEASVMKQRSKAEIAGHASRGKW